MNYGRHNAVAAMLVTLTTLGGCESLPENIVSTPEVELRNVQVMGLGFKSQTFLLSFDISNPNPFRLPVNHIAYDVRLDGRRFATGETASDLSIPANGDSQFAISVDLDLLSTAPQLLATIREGVRGDIPYELEGQLGIDIPMAPPVRYRTTGSIRLLAEGR